MFDSTTNAEFSTLVEILRWRALNHPDQKAYTFLSDREEEHNLTYTEYELLLAGAKFADQHDFTAVWVPERPFHPFGGLYPNPSVLASALAVTPHRSLTRLASIFQPRLLLS